MKKKLKIPTDGYKVVVLSGDNGTGKTDLLLNFVEYEQYKLYTEKFTNGSDRLIDILNFCRMNDFVVIDNIDLYLDMNNQETIIQKIFEINPNITLLCTTHSPLIIMKGWLDKVVNIEDYNKEIVSVHSWYGMLTNRQKKELNQKYFYGYSDNSTICRMIMAKGENVDVEECFTVEAYRLPAIDLSLCEDGDILISKHGNIYIYDEQDHDTTKLLTESVYSDFIDLDNPNFDKIVKILHI